MTHPELALGVLSTATLPDRRALIRATWGREAPRHGVLLRFVLGGATPPLTAEHASHRDLFFADGVDEALFYTDKVFVWLSHGARLGTAFVGYADDDAYIRLANVALDLRAGSGVWTLTRRGLLPRRRRGWRARATRGGPARGARSQRATGGCSATSRQDR